MTSLLTADALVALVSLSAMEIVLGIDNVVFIAILTARLAEARDGPWPDGGHDDGARHAHRAALRDLLDHEPDAPALHRRRNRPGALWARPHPDSWRDVPHLQGDAGDLRQARGRPPDAPPGRAAGRASWTLVQILLLDIVFSLDSVITAIGMSSRLPVMIAAMVVAMVVMLASMGAVSGFVERHPSVKLLALSFLLLIGVMLVVEGMGQHVSKGYIYFAMAFALLVELLNMRYRRRRRPLRPPPPLRGVGVRSRRRRFARIVCAMIPGGRRQPCEPIG